MSESWGSRTATKSLLLDHMLLGVFPYSKSTTDMHIERPDDTNLRDLNTRIQHVDQLNRDTFPLTSEERERERGRLILSAKYTQQMTQTVSQNLITTTLNSIITIQCANKLVHIETNSSRDLHVPLLEN